MLGLPNAVYQCNLERSRELSERISARNMPSQPLEPQYSLRPVPTKYTLLPIIDERKAASYPLLKYPIYDINNTFNPGTNTAPWSGFSTNVNTESKLRNQYFALQSCDQSQYIPSSNSDLFQNTIQNTTPTNKLVFHEEEFLPFNPNTMNLGYNIFNNSTKTQMLDVCDKLSE